MKHKRKKIGSLIGFLIPLTFFAGLGYLWFDAYRAVELDTTEVDRYYELLKLHDRPGKALTLSAGIDEFQSIETAMTRLQSAMELERYPINLVYGDQAYPPGFVTNYNGERMTITLSKALETRHEQLSVLAHEFSHVSVWSLDQHLSMNHTRVVFMKDSILFGCDQEKVVDTSGVFRGQGVLSLNGLTESRSLTLEGGTSTEQKTLGYLKPAEFGYLLARYCKDRGILASNVAPFLEPTGRKYFNIGRNLLAKKNTPPWEKKLEPTGIFWCTKCGEENKINLSVEQASMVCKKCGKPAVTRVWWQDASQQVVQVLEKVKKNQN